MQLYSRNQRNNKKRNIKYAIIGGIAAFIILMFVLAVNTSGEREDLSGPEAVLREVLWPFQQVAGFVSDKFSVIGDYFGGMDQLREENARLQEENNRLQEEIVDATETNRENDRLKELLNYAEDLSANWEYVTTSIVNRSQSNWYSTMIINGGEDQGFAVGQAVVASGGLVGRIINVTAHTSEVLLICDQDGAVAGVIQSTRTFGVVEGTNSSSAELQMVHIPYTENIEKYDSVITSGLGGVYPKGLLIGYISDITTEPGGLTMVAVVKSYVDFDSLEEVMVLTPVTGQ